MSRIFPSLASISLGLFLVTIILGLMVGDLYEVPPNESTLQSKGVHMLTGTAAALAVVFVHSIGITYFVGTSRWCKEVTETYQLNPEFLRESTILKRKTFPWAVIGMLGVVGIAALGAASDPGTGRTDTATWAQIHLGGALLGIAFIAWTYYRAWLNIVANQAVIQKIVDAVAVIRQERGLDTKTQPQPQTESVASEPSIPTPE